MTDKPLCRNIARNVVALRQERGLTYVAWEQRMAAEGQPIPVLSLRRIERGERKVDADELHALAKVFGVPPHRLLIDAPKCEQCNDAPMPGYACLTCGAKGERP